MHAKQTGHKTLKGRGTSINADHGNGGHRDHPSVDSVATRTMTVPVTLSGPMKEMDHGGTILDGAKIF